MTVDVEIADVPVALFAHVVRQPSHGQKIARTKQRDAIFRGKAFAGKNLFCDWLQACVADRGVSHSCFRVIGWR